MNALHRVLAVGFVGFSGMLPCGAQTNGFPVSGPITIGKVTLVDPVRGVMTIRADKNGRQITFYGMDRARVEYGTGALTGFAGIQPDMNVTVEYTPANGRWYVGRVIIPTPPAVAERLPRIRRDLTGAERKALRTTAANDGDITTQPGVKARIDNDITTQPGKKDPYDRDITKKTDR